MLNMNNVVSGVTGAINPSTVCTIQLSSGYTTNTDGSRVPQYQPAFNARAQVQELTERDLRQADALNLQGTLRSIYLSGWLSGAVRLNQQGGDIVTMPSGDVYLVSTVRERWNNWVKVLAVLQVQPANPPFILGQSQLGGQSVLG